MGVHKMLHLTWELTVMVGNSENKSVEGGLDTSA